MDVRGIAFADLRKYWLARGVDGVEGATRGGCHALAVHELPIIRPTKLPSTSL